MNFKGTLPTLILEALAEETEPWLPDCAEDQGTLRGGAGL